MDFFLFIFFYRIHDFILIIYTSHRKNMASPPIEYRDVISGELMIYPVMTCDGHSFELDTIQHWLRDHDTNPIRVQF